MTVVFVALFFALISPACASPSPCAELAASFDTASTPTFLASYPDTAIRELKDAAFLSSRIAVSG